jgi:hypothetical protein
MSNESDDPLQPLRWKDHLSVLGFRDHGQFGAMRGVCRGVTFIAIPHPLHGLSIAATYVNPRTAYDRETFVPIDASLDILAKVIVGVFEELKLRDRDEPTGA